MRLHFAAQEDSKGRIKKTSTCLNPVTNLDQPWIYDIAADTVFQTFKVMGTHHTKIGYRSWQQRKSVWDWINRSKITNIKRTTSVYWVPLSTGRTKCESKDHDHIWELHGLSHFKWLGTSTRISYWNNIKFLAVQISSFEPLI